MTLTTRGYWTAAAALSAALTLFIVVYMAGRGRAAEGHVIAVFANAVMFGTAWLVRPPVRRDAAHRVSP